ncbi:spermidine synthase, partial [Micromonospora sp. Rc5]
PGRFVRSELATVAAAFRHVALVAPPDAVAGRTGANFLIVASDAPLPLAPLAGRVNALPEAAIVLAGDVLTSFVGDALVLTDDYAPVDQLLATA